MTLSFNNKKMPPLRGFLALVIVLGHFSYFMEGTFVSAMTLAAPASVAFFLFISGYGLTCSIWKEGMPYLKTFLLSKIVRIVLPALLVVLLHALLCGRSGVVLHARARLVLANGNTFLPHYWFVWTILYDYLLFYLSWRFLPRCWTKYVILAGVLVFLSVTILSGYDRCWWMCALSFPAGVFFAEYEQPVYSFVGRNNQSYWLTLLGLALLTALLFMAPVLWTRVIAYTVCPLFLTLCVARLPLDKASLPVLGFLGAISYEIYLVHITMMSFLHSDVVWIASKPLYMAAVFASTILTAWLIHLLCGRLLRRVR